MADFYFFTNPELLDPIGTGNGQTAQEAYGNVGASSSTDTFQISSIHRSNDTAPLAYAVSDGRAAVYLPEDPLATTCTVILKPSTQPAEISGVSLPPVKYFVYHGILIDSLLDSSRTQIAQNGNNIDWIDYIWSTHPDSVDNNIPAPAVSIMALEFSIGPGQSPISFSFIANNTSTYPNVDAGDSIGKFDPLGFSFEIILDDYRYDPILEKFFNPALQGSLPHSKVIAAPQIPTPGSASKLFFENRNLREEILNYIDPAAFFASFYNAKLNSKNFGGTKTSYTGNQIAENLLIKFQNKNIVYLDIRNEHNHSFNYYKDLTDSDGYYSHYTDTVELEVKNSAGDVQSNKNYYSEGWPILRLLSPIDIASHPDDINIINVKLPIGNNENPMYFLGYGYLKTIGLGVGGNFPDKETGRRRRFKRPSDEGGGYYSEFPIVIPNISSLLNAGAWYTRINYLRQVNDRTATDPQFLDYQFLPRKLKQHLQVDVNEVGFTVYETNNFIDLKPENNNSDFIGYTGIAKDNIGITMFTYPQYKRGSLDKKLSAGMSMVASGPVASTKSFLDYMDDSYVKNGLIEGELSIGTPSNKKKFYQFERQRSINILHKLFDGPKDQFVAMVIKQENWDILTTFINSKITSGELDASYDITYTIKNRNDDDGNPKTDYDDEFLPKDTNLQLKRNQRYLKFELCVRGINIQSPNEAIPITFETGIEFVGSRENLSEKLNPIFVDININESLIPGAPRPLTCQDIFINDPTKSRNTTIPDLVGKLSEQVNFIYSEDFEAFIKHVFKETIILSGGPASGTTLTGVINSKRHGVALVYKHVLSKFIAVETNPISSVILYPVSTDVTNGEHTSGEILENYTDIYVPLGVTDSTSTINIQMLRDSNGKLEPSSPITHEGLLLEAAYLFATWKISLDINFFKNKRELLKNNFGFGILSIDDQIKFAEFLEGARNNYVFLNNFISIFESEQIVDPSKLLDTNPPNLFQAGPASSSDFRLAVNKFISIFDQTVLLMDFDTAVFVSYLEFIQDRNYSPFAVTDNSGLRHRFHTKIIELKSEYVNLLTGCIYEELGGAGSNVNTVNKALGSAEVSSSFITTDEGLFLFLYSLESPTDPNFQTSGDHGQLELSRVVKFELNTTRITPGSPIVLHFAIYGIDQTVNQVGDQINSFRILEYTKTGGTVHNDTFILDNHKYIVNPINRVWTDSFGNVLGYFVPSTKDMVVTAPDIETITFELKETLTTSGDGDIKDSKGDNVVYLICSAEIPPLNMIRYAKAFDDIFADDVFQLTASQQANIWNISELENIDKFIGLISSNTSFEVNMKGGFIGMPVVPFPFVSSITYKQNDRVMYGNEIYRADNNTNSIPGIGNWTKISFVTGTQYQKGDLISVSADPLVSSGIYKAKVNFTSGTVFDSNDWDTIILTYDGNKSYVPGDLALVDNQIRFCVIRNEVAYDPQKWIITSQVTSDPNYEFDPSNNWASVNKIEVINPPSPSSLEFDEFKRVRYAFSSIQWNSTLDLFVIDVEAFASPLISRLDNVMTINGKPVSLLNEHTIYGQDNTTDAKINRTPNDPVPTYIASYNQVLTALRCFGILRATIDSIIARANDPVLGLSPGTIGMISSKLENAFENVTVQTTPAEGSISFSEIDYNDYNALKLP